MGVNPFTARQAAAVPRVDVPITDAQSKYLTSLLTQKAAIKGMDHDAAAVLTEEFVSKQTKAFASQLIDQAKADNDRLRKLFAPLIYDAKQAKANAATTDLVLDDGMYVVGETVFKLYHTVHGSNQLCAKELVIEGDDGHFVYRGKAPLVSIAQTGRRLTLDEARAFGAIYGQCCRCLLPLTDEVSIALGLGPVCGGREYGDEFKVLIKAEKDRQLQTA